MSAADEIATFYVHTVTVETFAGTGAYGDTFEPVSEPIDCFISEKRRYVRDSNGEQIVSETTIWTWPEHYDKFTPDSRVHARGYESTVITRSLADSQELDLPDHLGVYLK